MTSAQGEANDTPCLDRRDGESAPQMAAQVRSGSITTQDRVRDCIVTAVGTQEFSRCHWHSVQVTFRPDNRRDFMAIAAHIANRLVPMLTAFGLVVSDVSVAQVTTAPAAEIGGQSRIAPPQIDRGAIQ